MALTLPLSETRFAADARELRARLERLQAHLAEDGIAAALLTQNVDRFYFTGTMQAGFILVPARGEALILIRRDRERALRESPLPVEALASLRELPERIRTHLGGIPAPFGLELDVLPWAQAERLASLLGRPALADASRAVLRTRVVKSPAEVELIREAARVVSEVVELVPSLLSTGMTELALAGRLEGELRARGHAGLIRMRGFNQEIFFGHVIAGAAGAVPSFLDAPTGGTGLGPAMPQGSSVVPIPPGAPIIVDLVGSCGGYQSDQTRVYCLGAPEAYVEESFEAALAVERAVAEAALPGTPASQLYRIAVETARSTGLGAHFMGERAKVGFVGHGVGLELDEPPFLAPGQDEPLREGMVFALEPKFVFDGRGVVGIEDTFVVTPVGAKRLTPSPQVLGVVPRSSR